MLISTWSALDARRRAIVIGATLAVFLAVLGLARMAGAPRMALLYSGLDPAAAGEVIAALDRQGVAYEIEGSAIRVEAARRDALRMILAGEGLPAAGGQGYELLDGLSGFGTTAQMFDAAYWRAREGELARTILAMPGLRAARVHLAQAPAQPFGQAARPTASVAVTTTGAPVTAVQARALRHLVAAAVPGMTPADVAVIDSASGLLPGEEDTPAGGGADERAAAIKRNVERLLAARLGPGRAVVEVSLELATERESITERRFDPSTRVAIATETEERSGQSTEPGGQVTVASNLPEGAAAAGDPGRSQTSETRERVNYEVSETSRQLERLPGAVRRLTVAVLVDGVAAGGAPAPRPDEEIAALRELVASAVGLDESRGDVLTVKSMPFEGLPAPDGPAAAGLLAGFTLSDAMALAQVGVLAVVALLLGFFVLRPLLLSGRTLPALAEPLALAAPASADAGDVSGLRVLTGEIEEPGAAPATGAAAATEAVERLRRLIAERQAESAEILRGWMEADEERA